MSYAYNADFTSSNQACNIFLDEPAYQEENTIDVIVRTSRQLFSDTF